MQASLTVPGSICLYRVATLLHQTAVEVPGTSNLQPGVRTYSPRGEPQAVCSNFVIFLRGVFRNEYKNDVLQTVKNSTQTNQICRVEEILAAF